MNRIIIVIVWLLMIASYLVRAMIGAYGNHLADEVSRMEKETAILQRENMELEKEMYNDESLRYAAEKAKEWGFTQEAGKHMMVIKN